MKFGMVVIDCGGGDYCFCFLDEARWKQVSEVEESGDYEEIVGWLTCADPEVAPPENAPKEKQGSILLTKYAQRYIPEDVGLTGELLGFIAF